MNYPASDNQRKTNTSLHQLFSQQVTQNPDAPAVSYGEAILSYRQLDCRANQLANHLLQLGVVAETIVGLCVERSIDTIVSILAILKAGGAYLPLDPNYPSERLAYILEDSQAPIIISESDLEHNFNHRAMVVLLDRDADKIAQQTQQAPTLNISPDNLLFVIYTSGSTGKSKGVMATHGNVASLFEAVATKLPFNNQDIWTMFHSYSFGFSVWEIWGALLHGGKLIIVPQYICAAAEEFYDLVHREKVTVLSQTPSAFNLFVRADCAIDKSLSLRFIVFSGEALEPYLLKSWVANHGDDQPQLVNMYAMCETAGEVTYKRLKAQDIDHAQRSIIGSPLPHVTIHLLDESRQPVSFGTPGEMYIGGKAIARGYLNKPELNAQKFIADPFSSQPKARLYRTGDRARYLPDGQLEFLGRGDRQVKIRGFRVELGGIEAVLGKHQAVSEVVVVLREDIAQRQILVAYLVFKQQIAIAKLRSFLKGHLPKYAIPQYFVQIQQLPLTANGKLDLAALPAPSLKRQSLATDYVAPRNQREKKLSQIWQKVLGIKQIGVKDNYFELGGTSILAARLFTQIEKQLGKNLPLATIFQAPTIVQLAEMLEQVEPVNSPSSLVPIQPLGFKPPLFCIHNAGGHTFSYQYLAFQLQGDRPVYGLQSQGLNGRHEPYICIEDMASHYIKEIRTVQPNGPYYLGGHSLGGILAWEMAQQLNQLGEQVAFLGLFDCYGYSVVELKNNLATWLAAHLQNIEQLDQQEKFNYVSRRLNWYIKKTIPDPLAQAYTKIVSQLLPSSQLLRRQIENINRQAAALYQPTAYSGRVTLFQTKVKLAKSYQDPYGGWRDLALGGLDIHQIPGEHHNFLIKETDAQVFVNLLRDCLQQVEAK